MEGLAGTAIRPAVRVPSCPQAPVLGRAQRSASGEGLLLRVAQATTTLPATGPGTRHHARRAAASFRRQPLPPEPVSRFKGSGPCLILRITRTSRPPRPGPRALRPARFSRYRPAPPLALFVGSDGRDARQLSRPVIMLAAAGSSR